jgi:hypothetical protein
MFVRSTAEPLAQLADAVFQFAARDISIRTPIGPRTLHFRNALPGSFRNGAEFRGVAGANPEVLLETLEALGKIVPHTLVLILDQGEEVLTLNPAEAGERSRALFFDFLLQFMQAQLDLKLLVALRTEFFGRFVSLSRRGLRGSGIAEYFLDELSDEQVVDAVRRPTLSEPRGGLGAPHDFYQFDFDEDVVKRVVREIGRVGGKLPALQIVCSRLYEQARSRPQPWRITHHDLDESRGVEGAIESFLDDQIFDCGKRQGLTPVECDKEIEVWKEALCGLVRALPDGTVTTDLKSEAALRNDLVGSRLNFDQTVERLASDEARLIRHIKVVSAGTGDLIPCYGLGHDCLGLVLRNWKMRLTAVTREDIHAETFSLQTPGELQGGQVTSTILMDLSNHLQDSSDWDYLRVDVGGGHTWLLSRLIIFVALQRAVRNLRCIVFVESEGGIERLLGIADPVKLCSVVASRYPWFNEILASLLIERKIPIFMSGAIDERAVVDVITEFVHRLQTSDDHSGDPEWSELASGWWEHTRWLISEMVRKDLSSALFEPKAAFFRRPNGMSDQDFVVEIIRRDSQFVALIGDQGEFRQLYDKQRIFDRVENRLRGSMKSLLP